jgi:hypothetical protein
MFPSLHVSDDRLTELDVEWVMERAVENELVHASRQLASLRSLVERRGCMVVIDRAFR